MNKIKFFALTALTVMMLAFVSCGGKKDVTYSGKFGTLEFKGETVTFSCDGKIDKGTYTGNAAKKGTVGINITEESSDDGQTFYSYSTTFKATVDGEVLTLYLDGEPFTFTVVK